MTTETRPGASHSFSLTHFTLLFLSFSISLSMFPCLLSVSPWWQQVSEPAYGFILFDYITGNVEGQADKSQLL